MKKAVGGLRHLLARLRDNPDFQEAVVAQIRLQRDEELARLPYLREHVSLAQGRVQAFNDMLSYLMNKDTTP